MKTALFWICLLHCGVLCAKVSQVLSPVAVNKRLVGEIVVSHRDGRYFVEKDPLFAVMDRHIAPDLIEKLKKKFVTEKNVDVTDNRVEELTLKYNEFDLVLDLNVDAKARGLNVVSFAAPPPDVYSEQVIEPTWLSGYFNLRGSKLWDHPGPTGETENSPFNGSIEGVLNLLGVVAEGNVDYTENASTPWRRRDVRMTWDDEKRAVRYALGDINYPVLGFQSFRPMAGLSVSRNFAIQPYRVVTPAGYNQFFLEHPSRVRIFVNGVFFREVELDEGVHDLRSLPVIRGLNEVEIEIIDPFGRREVLVFPLISESVLLTEGIHQFSFNVGAPSIERTDERVYEQDLVTSSVFYRLGLTEQLTVGAHYQGDKRQNMAGGEILVGSPAGFLGLESARSHTESVGEGWAHRARYIYLGNRRERFWSQDFGLEVEYFDRNFASLQSLVPVNRFQMNVGAHLVQPLGAAFSSGFSYRYQFGRGEEEDARTFTTFLSYAGFRAHSFSVEYSHSNAIQSLDEDRFFVTWTWSGSGGGNYLLTTYNSQDERLRSEYQHTARIGTSQVGASISGSTSETGHGAGVAAEYVGQRFFTIVDHDRFFPKDELLVDSGRTRVDFGTALAFTTGSFAVSRPITDSFILVESDDSLEEYELGVNPAGNYALAEIDWFNTAILANQASYIYETVRIDTRSLPYGVTINGGENFTVKPTYRSGVHIDLGAGKVVYLRGRLFDVDGRPFELQTGEFRSPDGKINQPFFTDRKGRFSVEGLDTGTFNVVVFGRPELGARLTVPKEVIGEYAAGSIHLKNLRADIGRTPAEVEPDIEIPPGESDGSVDKKTKKKKKVEKKNGPESPKKKKRAIKKTKTKKTGD